MLQRAPLKAWDLDASSAEMWASGMVACVTYQRLKKRQSTTGRKLNQAVAQLVQQMRAEAGPSSESPMKKAPRKSKLVRGMLANKGGAAKARADLMLPLASGSGGGEVGSSGALPSSSSSGAHLEELSGVLWPGPQREPAQQPSGLLQVSSSVEVLSSQEILS